ncbi:ABC transporter substrate-binding protein [Roseomonas sp. AR75]|uniref:ABC transporter substrate-binding protein n=1 Tax=Roseomonas sp. AR75 TaxID=2562311 RepID=UPI0010C01667|nr:extracellular solute-binding protein [Roseomonas sp. AR75]
MTLTRRAVLGAAGLSLAAPALAQAEARLGIIGHSVHRNAVSQGPGGNMLGELAGPAGWRVEWLTFGVPEIHDRLFREASLREGAVDLAFLLNRYVAPRVAELFVPLDGPEGVLQGLAVEDIPEGMRRPFTFGGRLYGLPFRQATSGLFLNAALLEERGMEVAPPASPDALAAAVRRATFRRGDGLAVNGLVLDGPGPSQMIDLARMWDGDFLSSDLQLRVEEPAMLKALDLLRAFFAEGVLPRTFPRFSTEQVTTAMQQGRAAFAISPISRFTALNNPASSRYPGRIQVATVPSAPEIVSRFPVAPVKSEIWALAIPRNARNRDGAVKALRGFGSADASLRAALNGNGPVRLSTLGDPRYAAAVPWAVVEAAALRDARPPLPGWENAARAEDIFREEVEAMLVRNQPALEIAANIARRVRPLLG